MRGLRRPSGGRPASDHDRARSAAAERLIEELPADEAAWLEAHLAACDACRAVADAYAAQALAIRALPLPEPPRDLWARTAAALEAEVRRDARIRRRGRRDRRSFGPAPLGALAGAMVVVVVVGAALLADRGLFSPLTGPGGAPATPFAVEPQDVAWLAPLPDGTYALNFARLDRVCPTGATPDCAPIDASARKVITLTAAPRAVLRSPARAQYVVVDAATTSVGGTVYVVPVTGTGEASPPGPSGTPLAIATAVPSLTEGATAIPSAAITSSPASTGVAPADSSTLASTRPGASEAANARTPEPAASSKATAGTSPATSPTATTGTTSPAGTAPTTDESAAESESGAPSPSAGTEPASPEPRASGAASESVVVSPSPSASSGPTEPIAIISDAVVVGETAAYSPDGSWFAFTARPADGSHGPDIYVWHSGDLTARPVTSDHDSIFSSWLGERLVGSRPAAADLVFEPAPSPAGSSPGEASSSAGPTTSGSPGPDGSATATASPDGGVVIGDAPPAATPGPPAATPTRPAATPAPTPPGDDADATSSPGTAPSSPSASDAGAGAAPDAGASNASSPGPSPSPELATPGTSVARPLSFVIDPATGLESDLLGAPSWRPVVDPTGRWVVYWSGSIGYDAASQTWSPLDGGLVIAPVSTLAGSALATIMPSPTLETSPGASTDASGLSDGSGAPGTSGAPDASATTSPEPGQTSAGPGSSPSAELATPSPSPVPSATIPVGTPDGSPSPDASSSGGTGLPTDGSASPSTSATPLAPLTGPEPLLPVDPSAPPAGPLRDWDVRFDPTGSRLAVWTADPVDPSVGRLSLFAFDAVTGRLDPSATLLADQPALLGYSLDAGRIAWATPPGQDGAGSRLQVLAWLGDGSGRLTSESAAGQEAMVVVR